MARSKYVYVITSGSPCRDVLGAFTVLREAREWWDNQAFADALTMKAFRLRDGEVRHIQDITDIINAGRPKEDTNYENETN